MSTLLEICAEQNSVFCEPDALMPDAKMHYQKVPEKCHQNTKKFTIKRKKSNASMDTELCTMFSQLYRQFS